MIGRVYNATAAMIHLDTVRTEAAVRRILGAPDGPMTLEDAEAYRAAAAGYEIVRIRTANMVDPTEIRTVDGRVLWRGEWTLSDGAYAWRERWISLPGGPPTPETICGADLVATKDWRKAGP